MLPLVALGGYGLMASVPLLSIAFATKVAENSVDYSLQNTARQAPFLPTSREAKYQAKVAIDTFLVLGGDVLSALVVWLGIHLHAQLRTFARSTSPSPPPGSSRPGAWPPGTPG